MSEEKHKMRLSAHQEGDRTVIVAATDDAQMILKYTDKGKGQIEALIDSGEKILEYMWNDYLIRRNFTQQLENDLDKWLGDGGK